MSVGVGSKIDFDPQASPQVRLATNIVVSSMLILGGSATAMGVNTAASRGSSLLLFHSSDQISTGLFLDPSWLSMS
jgi:hypothetical protein